MIVRQLLCTGMRGEPQDVRLEQRTAGSEPLPAHQQAGTLGWGWLTNLSQEPERAGGNG